MATFKELNRYTNGIVTFTRQGKQFLMLRKALNLKESVDDLFIQINQDLLKRPDLISQKAYGTPSLWWVIAEYNEISDPLFDLKMNQILRIPRIERVTAAIKVMNK